MLQLSDRDIDVIVSNPPYIPEREFKSLHRRVTSFEPHQALFEPDNEPLKFYQEIIQFSNKYLTKSGLIFVELHQDYALQTAALFEKHFYKVVLRKDISGNYRMLMAAHLKGNQR
jgi:release factor glutamine methyltransferase